MAEGFGNMLVLLSVVIQRRYAQICADHDLTPAQAHLLCAMQGRPQRMADLACSLGMAKNALSQLVDRTERRGLVTREIPECDRRGIMVCATPAGREITDALYADVGERLPDIAESLGPDERELLEKLATAVATVHMPGLACPGEH